jgi:hypothetical protein
MSGGVVSGCNGGFTPPPCRFPCHARLQGGGVNPPPALSPSTRVYPRSKTRVKGRQGKVADRSQAIRKHRMAFCEGGATVFQGCSKSSQATRPHPPLGEGKTCAQGRAGPGILLRWNFQWSIVIVRRCSSGVTALEVDDARPKEFLFLAWIRPRHEFSTPSAPVFAM